MTILLIAEHDNATLSDQTNKALSAAKEMGGDIHVLVAGKDAKAAADAASKLDGVSKVLLADDASLEQQLAEPMAALIVSLADGYDTFVAPGDDQWQEHHAPRRCPARRDAGLRYHRGRKRRHVQASDLCRQRDPDGAGDGCERR
jgi:electron transfer flavoprotein alpha subunit